MSDFSIKIHGKRVEAHHPPQAARMEGRILEAATELVAALRAEGHEVTFGTFASEHLAGDLAAGMWAWQQGANPSAVARGAA